MKTNNKKWILIGVIAVAVGAGWWIAGLSKKTPDAPVSTRTDSEQQLVDSVLEAPEQLDASAVASVEPHAKLAAQNIDLDDSSRPQLLSEVEKPPRTTAKPEPVSIKTLHFWKDYASVRKPEIRDPDSQENRAEVVALMKARQRRLGQVEQ